jgi:nucleoside-diphosphate-sugar epimerase
MRIVVTGGSGKMGYHVVKELVSAGHDPIPLDIKPARDPAMVPQTRIVNLLNMEELLPHFEGADAVCHLGNLPGFMESGPARGFENNVVSTFNVFQAAEQMGIRRIVSASSIQVYGVLPGMKRYNQSTYSQLQYLPLDEEHPRLPTNAYPLSKATGEWIAESFVRRNPDLTVYSLRLTLIHRNPTAVPVDHPDPDAFFTKTLFTYIQADDAARCARLCCEKPRPGHTPINVASRRSDPQWRPELLERLYGKIPPFRKEVARNESLLDTTRAEQIVGFVARS